MLKEVGASGQISLGKKYAGQLFDMTVQPDGSIVMQPVKVVPVVQEQVASYQVWTQENAQRIEQYNAWAEGRQPYSQRVRQWREAK